MRRLVACILLLGLLSPAIGQEAAPDTPTTKAQRIAAILEAIDSVPIGRAWDRAVELEDIVGNDPSLLTGEVERHGPMARLVGAHLLLGHADDVAFRLLRDIVLDSRNPVEVRTAAAELLAVKGRGKQDAAGLEDILTRPEEPILKIAVARTLWNQGRNVAGTRYLKDLLQVEDPELRSEAALALGELGNVEAAKSVLDSLANEPTARGARARHVIEREELYQMLEANAGLDRDQLVQQLKGKVQDLEAEVDRLSKRAATSTTGGDPFIQEIQSYIQKYYVDEGKTDAETLLEGAARGMVAQLGDRFSSYMPPAAAERFQAQMEQEYAGIGAVVGTDPRSGYLMVVRPIYDGPAYEAGLRSNDVLISIDGISTQNVPVEDIVTNLKGPAGSSVTLEVERSEWEEPQVFTLTRRKIHVDSVMYEMLPGHLGYLRLAQFGQDAVQEVEDALNELESEGMVGLIFDLRGNPGGLLDAAWKIVDMFLPEGKLVVYSEGRNPEIAPRREYRSRAATTHPPYPIVALVNGSSASASEIFSGAMRDHDRARLVGEKTFGKGSVQQLLPIRARDGKAKLRLTIAYYYLPSGELIHGHGVAPHVEQVQPPVDRDYLAARTRLQKAGALEAYIQSLSDADLAVVRTLAEFDGLDAQRYPGFGAWIHGLEIDPPIDAQHARQAIRERIRSLVQDEHAREFACDVLDDVQLQRGIIELLRKLGADVEDYSEYQPFADKFAAPAEK